MRLAPGLKHTPGAGCTRVSDNPHFVSITVSSAAIWAQAQEALLFFWLTHPPDNLGLEARPELATGTHHDHDVNINTTVLTCARCLSRVGSVAAGTLR